MSLSIVNGPGRLLRLIINFLNIFYLTRITRIAKGMLEKFFFIVREKLGILKRPETCREKAIIGFNTLPIACVD